MFTNTMANGSRNFPTRTGSSGSTSSASSQSSLKPPRSPRFVEATSIHSPIDQRRDLEKALYAETEVANVGFGYLTSPRDIGAMPPMSPLRSPLKSALKVPGSFRPETSLNPLSPTYHEEVILAAHEKKTNKRQKKDLKIKIRVRLAKFALKTIDFSCSLIIISMLTATLLILNATKHLPAAGPLTAWPAGVSAWPQILVIALSSFQLLISIWVFIGYCKGGHRRAEKIGNYYDLYNCGFFVLTMIIWGVTATLFENSRNNSGSKDIWSWSCADNQRSAVFSAQVQFSLICRFQSWTLICLIVQIVINVLWVLMYVIVFYRYWTKRRLFKTMEGRNRAKSDLYLAQLRTQSAPNTPGFMARSPGLKSPSVSQFVVSPRQPVTAHRTMANAGTGESPFTPGRPTTAPQSQFAPAMPQTSFKLQAPPAKARKGASQSSPSLAAFTSTTPPRAQQQRMPSPPAVADPTPAGDDEPQYAAVSIPGAYAGAVVKTPTRARFAR